MVTIGFVGPFDFRLTYASFLYRQFRIYGSWFISPHALLHVLAFGLLGFLAFLISERWLFRVAGMIAIQVLGLFIEWTQLRFHPGNSFEVWDLSTNSVGVCLGMIVAYAWSEARNRSDKMFTS